MPEMCRDIHNIQNRLYAIANQNGIILKQNSSIIMKRLFQVLDELNQIDEQSGSALCGVCSEVVSVNKNGHNGTITIGVPGEIAQEIALGKSNKRLILCIVDGDAYDKIKSE